MGQVVIKEFVTLIRKCLEAASGIARAAHLCAQAGSVEKAIEIAQDLSDDLREAKRVFEATLTVSRYSKG
jgi:hypothetical protein